MTVARSQVDTLERFDPERANVQREDVQRKAANIKLSFVGANPHPRIEPFDRLDTVVSYFIGNDPDKWRPDVPVWGGVRYVDLYPGVDLEITSEGGQMVQRLAARPGADLSAVRLRVEGADAVTVDGDALRLSTAAGEVRPAAAAGRTGRRRRGRQCSRAARRRSTLPRPLPSTQSALGNADNRQSQIRNPRPTTPPTCSTAPSWAAVADDWGYGIAVDGAGSAYVTGYTYSSDFPTTPGAFDTSYNGGWRCLRGQAEPGRQRAGLRHLPGRQW